MDEWEKQLQRDTNAETKKAASEQDQHLKRFSDLLKEGGEEATRKLEYALGQNRLQGKKAQAARTALQHHREDLAGQQDTKNETRKDWAVKRDWIAIGVSAGALLVSFAALIVAMFALNAPQ